MRRICWHKEKVSLLKSCKYHDRFWVPPALSRQVRNTQSALEWITASGRA